MNATATATSCESDATLSLTVLAAGLAVLSELLAMSECKANGVVQALLQLVRDASSRQTPANDR